MFVVGTAACGLAVGGCVPPASGLGITPARVYENEYTYALSSVTRPASAVARFGGDPQTIIQQGESAGAAFSDGLIAVSASPQRNRIDLLINNRSDDAIRIIWEQAAFVDVVGESSPVMHVGVRYSDCSGPKTPSVVVAHSSLTDNVIPCANVKLPNGLEGGWSIDPLVQGPMSASAADSATALQRTVFIGKHIRLLLPIEVAQARYDYTFDFAVTGAHVVRWTPALDRVP